MAATKTAGIRYAPEDPTLPKPWRGLIDAKTGYIYFWNPETNVTQYQKPITSDTQLDSPNKCVSVATCASVQVQQSSPVTNQVISTIDYDNDRNGGGSDGRPKVDSGGRSDQNHKSVTGWMLTEGTAVEVSLRKENFDVWHAGTVMKPTADNKCLVKYYCPGIKEHIIQEFAECPDIRPSPPSLEDNDFNLLDKVEAYFECCWWSGIIRRLLEDKRWINEAKNKRRPSVFAKQSVNLNRQQGRAEERQAGNGCVLTERDNTGAHVEDIVDKECLTKEVYMSVKEVKGARSAENCDISQKKDQETHTVDSIKGSIEGNSRSKRKRGRPKMLSEKQIGGRSAGVKMDMQNSYVGDEAKLRAENDCVLSTSVEEIPNNGDFHASTHIPLLNSQAEAGETAPSKRVDRLKNSVSNGHGELSRSADSESQNQECHEIDNVKDDNMMIDEVGNINDDQPLSMWLNALPPVGSDDSRALPVQDQCANAKGRNEGFETPLLATVDTKKRFPLQKTDGPGNLPIENLNGCAESNEKGCELGTPALVSIDTVENQSLPFAKRTPVWKVIESMELYKTQKPHFSPLIKYEENMREGLAIGTIVNFSNLVESTSKLQFSCDITIIEGKLESLAEYESHGFDVEKVRACLTQLLSKKQTASELQKEYDNIGSEIHNSLDEGKLDEEINQLYQKLKEIEKKLAEAKLAKEMVEKKISALQTRQDVVVESVQSLEADFESIVGSLNS
ncbi:hypothetical protein POM88_031702 [Heracleum sosnowskyi]|uniref:WW domain-containing protein n=1 Tax=Heracleum sosnowskyi TaxID=360622 RepID=A0AAD8HZ53_9APIA|nr:hypothetical protein POM88_031702 [Heracleum sosnowskyi]